MKLTGFVFALLLSAPGAAAATPLSPADQAALQGTMFQFIERQLVGDAFLDEQVADVFGDREEALGFAVFPAGEEIRAARKGDAAGDNDAFAEEEAV